MPRTTLDYWVKHPYVLEGRKPGSGREYTFDEQTEQKILAEVRALNESQGFFTKFDVKRFALRHGSADFRCSDTWLDSFSKRNNVHWWRAHPVSKAQFEKVRASEKLGNDQSEQELDMLFSIADVLAKRSLMADRGLTDLNRWTVLDEMRFSPHHLFTDNNRVGVFYNSATGEDKPQRAYVPCPVSMAFEGNTIIFTMSLSGEKRAPLIIMSNSKDTSKADIPSQEDLANCISGISSAQLPNPLVAVAYGGTSWNNSTIHSTEYLNKVVLASKDFNDSPSPPSAAENRLPSAPCSPPSYRPKNPHAEGMYPPNCVRGEIHDVFGGHYAARTHNAYRKAQVALGVIAANCTGFMQWNDKYLHQVKVFDFDSPLSFYSSTCVYFFLADPATDCVVGVVLAPAAPEGLESPGYHKGVADYCCESSVFGMVRTFFSSSEPGREPNASPRADWTDGWIRRRSDHHSAVQQEGTPESGREPQSRAAAATKRAFERSRGNREGGGRRE